MKSGEPVSRREHAIGIQSLVVSCNQPTDVLDELCVDETKMKTRNFGFRYVLLGHPVEMSARSVSVAVRNKGRTAHTRSHTAFPLVGGALMLQSNQILQIVSTPQLSRKCRLSIKYRATQRDNWMLVENDSS